MHFKQYNIVCSSTVLFNYSCLEFVLVYGVKSTAAKRAAQVRGPNHLSYRPTTLSSLSDREDPTQTAFSPFFNC